ncbi:DUF1697 domain-containing protein [Curtobacterium ammoniigenes]|uniref:DUF1697 domain-containing protein n=1 Tax=Curtobacterium ammoniigenes TaxID=395387 RepID=UPI0008333195|nr:DUF1697 domain-containing protein [Curtobacterium ammoniigenes]
MTGWVALLRGVNVNGVTVKSVDLRAAFASMGFPDAKTVLASGNVLFDAEVTGNAGGTGNGDGDAGGSADERGSGTGPVPSAQSLAERIESGLAERFGYDAHIVLVSAEHISRIIAGYPFPEDDDHHAYVVFGSDREALAALAADATGDSGPRSGSAATRTAGSIADNQGEQIAHGDGCLYWRCPKGRSTDTPFAKRAASVRFRATTTTRNLNTVRKFV